MRQITPLELPDVERHPPLGGIPEFRTIEMHLFDVDSVYQRDLSQRSMKLISRIVGQWDWSRFKPPVVSRAGERFIVIDGQHTLIAAATLGFTELPCMVVAIETQADQASSFVGHNRDRIAVTPTQLHVANVAAGDEMALEVHKVCERAGVRILQHPPSFGRFKPGETMAVSAIRSLVSRRFPFGARQVLEVVVKGGITPVSITAIRAVEALLFEPEFKGTITAERITLVMLAKGESLAREVETFAVTHRLPQWRAMASVIFINRKIRGEAA